MYTVSVRVWDSNWFGKNNFLGEVKLPISSLDLTESTTHWYPLVDMVGTA